MVRLSKKKKKALRKNIIKTREKYIQIIMPFYKANKNKLENLRMEFWNSYNANAQSHTSYLLTTVGALAALFAGWQTIFQNIVVGSTLLLIFAGLAIVSGWLVLRHQYWCTLSSQILALTSEDILLLFNRWNEKNRHYQNHLPPCSAVMTYALSQQIIDLQKDYSWIHNPHRKLAFLTSSLRNID